jgi:hypothetical protein
MADNTPPAHPIAIAPQGSVIISETAPIATPPARVALSIISISSFPKRALATNAAPTQLPLMASTVLTTTLYCYAPTARAPLKDGQNIHKKILPTIATVLD